MAFITIRAYLLVNCCFVVPIICVYGTKGLYLYHTYNTVLKITKRTYNHHNFKSVNFKNA